MRYLVLLLALAPMVCSSQETSNLVGASVRTRPKYDGSNERTVDLIPNLRYYRGPWFGRTTQGMLEGGARVQFGPFHAGAQLAYEAGPQDGDPGVSAGAHLEWDGRLGPAPVDVLLRVRQQLDSDHGALADLRSNVGVYRGQGFAAGVYAQATWANRKYFEAYYGARESGLAYAALGAFGGYDLAERWLLVANVEARRLSDQAMKGSFVARRTGTYAYAGFAYRF